MGGYKNIIWSYSHPNSVWKSIILFTPESMVGIGRWRVVNPLPIYLAKGGHLLTEGRSDRSGGLYAAFYDQEIMVPANVKCEMIGNEDACEGDTSGVNSMPYREYCVTMIDKIVGYCRTDPDMPVRGAKINGRGYDVMRDAYKATTDPRFAGLPAQLDMWSQVVDTPEKYFYPNSTTGPQGYTYVEIYDPAYWMDRNGITSQPCFHPLYRMRARNPLSVLNDQTIALALTRYENVVPETSGFAVAAPSFHFGLELWFMDHDQVSGIADAIFDEWGILANH